MSLSDLYMHPVHVPLSYSVCVLWTVWYAWCGWLYETIMISIQQRRFVNRGFLNGPYCPIYGVGAISAIALLDHIRNPFVVFMIAAVGACVLEYATSWIMEQLFHARWWDYSNFRFNLHGRICLAGAIVFGLFGVLIIFCFQPPIAYITSLIPQQTLAWIAGILTVIITIDVVVTVSAMLDFEQALQKLAQAASFVKQQVSSISEQATSEANDRLATWKQTVYSVLSAQQIRLIRAFPKFRSRDHNDIVTMLKAEFHVRTAEIRSSVPHVSACVEKLKCSRIHKKS